MSHLWVLLALAWYLLLALFVTGSWWGVVGAIALPVAAVLADSAWKQGA